MATHPFVAFKAMIYPGKTGLTVSVRLIGGRSVPSGGLRIILRATAVFREHHAEPVLGVSGPLIGGLAIPCSGFCMVLRDPKAFRVHKAEMILGVCVALLGGGARLMQRNAFDHKAYSCGAWGSLDGATVTRGCVLAGSLPQSGTNPKRLALISAVWTLTPNTTAASLAPRFVYVSANASRGIRNADANQFASHKACFWSASFSSTHCGVTILALGSRLFTPG